MNSNTITNAEAHLIDIHSPAGKNLNIMIELSELKYHPIVTKIFPNSVLINKLEIGDILVSIDNQNVAGMTLPEIERLLSKRKDYSRKITILRKDDKKCNFKPNLKIKRSAKKHCTNSSNKKIRDISSGSSTHRMMRSIYEKEKAEYELHKSLQRNKTQTLEVFVPKGKLGVQLKKNDDGKTIAISDIDPKSKLMDQVLIGDILLSVNDDNVTNMDLLDVSRLIMARSKEIRKLNILRSYCVQ